MKIFQSLPGGLQITGYYYSKKYSYVLLLFFIQHRCAPKDAIQHLHQVHDKVKWLPVSFQYDLVPTSTEH